LKDVSPERSLELFLGDLLDRISRMLFVCVVHQDVDLADLFHGLSHRFLTEFLVADNPIGIFLAKSDCERLANSAVPASNERNFVSQFAAAAMHFVIGFWPFYACPPS